MRRGKTVRAVTGIDPVTKAEVDRPGGRLPDHGPSGVIVTKTFRLFPNTDGLEVELKFESPDKERSVVYNLLGPARHPDRGRVVHRHLPRRGLRPARTGKKIETRHPLGQRRRLGDDEPIDNTTLPLAFAGVENQYFAILVEPDPLPTGDEDRWDSKTIALLLDKDEKAPQKSDVGVRITSKPIKIGPNQPVDAHLPGLRRSQDGRRPQALSRRGAGHVPQEPVDPAGAGDRPVRDHADPRLHLRRHRAGRPLLRHGRRATTASRSSC